MAKKIYKTALGNQIDIDAIRAKNETEIAVGNMYVNARGDELGPGGVVVRRREDVMKEYYAPSGGLVVGKTIKDPERYPNSAPNSQSKSPAVPLEQELKVNHGPRTDMVRSAIVEDDDTLSPEESLALNERQRLEERRQQQQNRTTSNLAPNPTMTPRPRFRGSLAEGVAMRGVKDVFQDPLEDPTDSKGIKRI
ncbi:MAG: hypothetical protein N2235_10615 [Fischerella sp.]|nr:hypothetical protein [Fischerella sp.]